MKRQRLATVEIQRYTGNNVTLTIELSDTGNVMIRRGKGAGRKAIGVVSNMASFVRVSARSHRIDMPGRKR